MAHGFLSYQDNRGDGTLLDTIVKTIKDYLDKDDEKKNVADMVAAKVNVHNEQKALSQGQTPLLKGGNQKQLAATPLQKMIGGTALQKSLPAGPAAVNPEVVGGGLARGGFNGKPLRPEGFASNAIVDIGATNLGVERDIGGTDMFVKTLSDVSGDSGEVVQAIDRLTMVTMSLVDATKQQTSSQQQIAAAQQQQSEKLGRKSLAAAEESSLEGGGDFSSNAGYLSLAAQGMGMMRGGGGGRGGGPGMGIGGKVMTKNILKAATKRGAARTGTRLGAAVGGKLLGGFGKKAGAKLGGKAIGKVAGGAIAKSLGKKIPLVGLGLGAVFAAQRAMQGDFLGAGLELASGAASTVPGLGTAGSVGIDAALAARDMTMMADGGIVDSATNAIIGEDGKEGVFPLEGSRGKKTFIQFGEGILNAQKRNKRDFAKIQAEGLKEYYDKGNGWGKFFEGLKEILGGFKFPGGYKPFNFDGPEEPDDPDADDRRTPNGGNVRALRHHRANDAQQLTGDTFMPVATPRTEAGNPAKNQHFNAPRDGGKRRHDGIDITDAYSGTDDPNDPYAGGPVVAYKSGKVEGIKPPTTPGADNGELSIKHPDGTKTRYYHVNPKAGLKNGDEVFGGQHIADMTRYYRGGTEQTHLHFELYNAAGDIVDPTKAVRDASNYLSSPLSDAQAKLFATSGVDPQESATNMDQYEKIKAERDKLTSLSTAEGLTSAISSNEGIKKAISENRSSTKRERFIIPGVGSAKTYTDMFIRGGRKNTFFNTAGEELTIDEMLELIKQRNAELQKQQVELMNRTSDAGGADQLNTASSEVLNASLPSGNTTIINNNGGNNGGGSSAVGNQVPIGSSSDDMGAGVYSNAHIRTLNC